MSVRSDRQNVHRLPSSEAIVGAHETALSKTADKENRGRGWEHDSS